MELGFEPRKGSNFTVLATVVVREIVWKRALQCSQNRAQLEEAWSRLGKAWGRVREEAWC